MDMPTRCPLACKGLVKGRIPLRIVAAWTGGLLLVWMLGWLVHAGVSAFTWNKFTLFDYGVYTNMIWNSGHGRPFECLVDRTYLATHLSFTLALLGPLFRLWDHPFLLWILQWGFLAGGTALLMRTACRLRIPAALILAIAVFYTGYHFTQQTLLSEFHGVSLLLLLVPWLYHNLVFSRRQVWLPWLLILGLREDAAVVILPLLLYFAIRDRWRAGFVYAALSLAYMIVAMTTLYPLLTGLSLLGRRHADLGDHPLAHFFHAATLRTRLKALFWVVLPALPFLGRKRWLPILVLPSAALIQATGGGTARQYSLDLHYATPAMACLTVALVESLARGRETRAPESRTASRRPLTAAILLLLVTLVSYRLHGFLPLGLRRVRCYRSIHGAGLCTLQAARRIPRDGLLLCPDQLAGYCANREQLIGWRHYDPRRHLPDLVFTELKHLDSQRLGFRAWMEEGRFGLIFFDGTNIILKRGVDPSSNHIVLDAGRRRSSGAPFAQSGSMLADIQVATLHWPGTGARAHQTMPAAWPMSLEAGDYDAVFLFSARTPEGDATGDWGTLQVRLESLEETLAEAAIDPVGGGPQILRTQRLSFSLAAPTRVQAVVVGQRAELWLVRADFVRRGEPWEF